MALLTKQRRGAAPCYHTSTHTVSIFTFALATHLLYLKSYMYEREGVETAALAHERSAARASASSLTTAPTAASSAPGGPLVPASLRVPCAGACGLSGRGGVFTGVAGGCARCPLPVPGLGRGLACGCGPYMYALVRSTGQPGRPASRVTRCVNGLFRLQAAGAV